MDMVKGAPHPGLSKMEHAANARVRGAIALELCRALATYRQSRESCVPREAAHWPCALARGALSGQCKRTR